MKTETTWKGKLQFEEGQPTIIRIGKLNINSVLHFVAGKRVVLKIQMVDQEDEDDYSEIQTMGKLEFHEKKKQFMFEKYPLVDFLQSFEGQRVQMHIGLDHSVLSHKMTYS